MQLISRDKQAHWYQWEPETGSITPCYSLPKAKGNGIKNPTLADAKKLKLMIGISSVANMLPKPQLTAWLQEQAIMAALTLPKVEGISIDEHAKLIVTDMDAQSLKAREFGTAIHDGIENILRGIQPAPELAPWLQGFREWADKWILDVHGLEQVVGDPALGVAGRLDLICTLKDIGECVIDFKTQRIKNGPTFYREWLPQLAAYEHCRRREDNIKREVASVIINTAEPSAIHAKVWIGAKELGFRVFQHCLELWKYSNEHDPAQC